MFWTLLASLAHAQSGIDAMENLFGATNVGAITGHGGMAAAVSPEGDITVLTWPTPSTSDQLAYVSSNALDARDQPRFGAPEGAGVVLGLRVGGQVHWLREGSATQDYGPADGANPHTVYRRDDLGLTATVVDAVDPSLDVLVRQVEIVRDPGVADPVDLVTYANLSPVPPQHKVPELPMVDWVMDGRNDFAAVYDPGASAVIHFHPTEQRVYDDVLDFVLEPAADWGPIGDALATGDVDGAALAAQLDAYGSGAWAGLTTVPPPSEHQVGYDGTDWCAQADLLVDNLVAFPTIFDGFELPVAPDVLEQLRCGDAAPVWEGEGWVYDAADPWADAQDGVLSGAEAAAGEVAEALITPVPFTGDRGVASVVLAMGAHEADVRTGLAVDPDAVVAAAEQALTDFEAGLTMAGPEGSRARAVTRRALINMRVGTDRATGALVASIARQPPYGLDWPRDGAFFNLLLDASGQSELVAQRSSLYADWQRDEPVEPTPLIDPEPPVDPDSGEAEAYPADAWEMNYTPDGLPGGNIRFEIDTTALAVWTIVVHCGWESDPEAYLRQHWDTIERGTDLLARWRDEATGLHAPAQEDDATQYTQTLHGAITVFATLDVSSRAARLLGEDEAADRWRDRAEELRSAMEVELYDEEEGRFVMDASGRAPFEASDRVPTGPGAWMVWPLRLLPWSDPRMEDQVRADMADVDGAIDLTSAGGAYFYKNTLSLAMAAHEIEALQPMADSLLPRIEPHATEGTDHFGEVMVVVDGPTGPAPSQRVANPHLWEGALFALTVWALEDPAALERWEEVLPPSELLPTEEAAGSTPAGGDDGGCGCVASDASPGGLLVLLGLAGLVRRRRVAVAP